MSRLLTDSSLEAQMSVCNSFAVSSRGPLFGESCDSMTFN